MSGNQILWKRNCRIVISNDVGSITIENMQVTFHADINMETNENKAVITIMNLTEAHREFVVRKNGKAKVYVSYGLVPNYGLLFDADILKSSNALRNESNKTKEPHVKHNTEWETTIELGDGVKQAKKLLQKAYKGKVDTTTIIKDALAAMPEITPPSDLDSLPKEIFDNGITISKSPMDTIYEMALKIGAKPVTQKKKMKIVTFHVNQSRNVKEVSAETGLLESPIKTDKGIEFAILIDPDLHVGDNVYIISKALGDKLNKQIWVITKMIIHGSLRENAWEMRCTAVLNKGEKVV